MVIKKKSLTSFISPKCFLLNRWENGDDDRASEKHLRNSKTSRGSYLDLELCIFVKIFEIYLVTQSL